MGLSRFEQKMYGEYGCSRCNKPLDGFIHCVGEEDEEGYHWRSFCPECWDIIQTMPNESIYKVYHPADLVRNHIRFIVGQDYDFPGLYGPGYKMKCVSRTVTHVMFSDGEILKDYPIEYDENFAECCVVWDYKDHKGYCWSESLESRMARWSK